MNGVTMKFISTHVHMFLSLDIILKNGIFYKMIRQYTQTVLQVLQN